MVMCPDLCLGAVVFVSGPGARSTPTRWVWAALPPPCRPRLREARPVAEVGAKMRFFGPEPWGPARDGEAVMVPSPIGELCSWCDEPILAGESGCITPYLGKDGTELQLQHRECLARTMMGSVGHQRGKCPCFGGTEEDPPGLTKREAAHVALAYLQRCSKSDLLDS